MLLGAAAGCGSALERKVPLRFDLGSYSLVGPKDDLYLYAFDLNNYEEYRRHKKYIQGIEDAYFEYSATNRANETLTEQVFVSDNPNLTSETLPSAADAVKILEVTVPPNGCREVPPETDDLLNKKALLEQIRSESFRYYALGRPHETVNASFEGITLVVRVRVGLF
jgi:hypothetical protein